MAGFTGTINTYDLTTGIKLDVEDMIWLISPFDVPLLGTNGADGRTTLSSGPCYEKLVQWLDETLLTPRSTLQNSPVTADIYVQVAAGNQIQFMTSDVILIDSEYMRVTGYGTTADSLLVTRGYGGSTAASHAANAPVVGMGQANPEGANPQNARAVDRNNRQNLTQIFGPYAVQVSGTENAVQKYGLSGTEFDHQVANRTKEALIAQEQSLLYGLYFEDTGNQWRTAGGMTYFIVTNVDTTTTAITETALLTQLEASYDAGGAVDRLVVGSKQKRNLSQINSSNIRYSQDTNVRGQVVDYYDSDYGRITICLDRWCRLQDIFGFSRDQAEVLTLRPFQFEMLAKTGDSIVGQVVGEKSFRFRRQQWAFRFAGLTS